MCFKSDAVRTICNFTVEHSKSTIGQTDDEKEANNAIRTTGELIDHFLSKIRFVFRPKTFPKNDSLTQKHSNAQDNNDVKKQNLSSIPSVKVETFS